MALTILDNEVDDGCLIYQSNRREKIEGHSWEFSNIVRVNNQGT